MPKYSVFLILIDSRAYEGRIRKVLKSLIVLGYSPEATHTIYIDALSRKKQGSIVSQFNQARRIKSLHFSLMSSYIYPFRGCHAPTPSANLRIGSNPVLGKAHNTTPLPSRAQSCFWQPHTHGAGEQYL
jgi:hypothetical protein